ncbi:LRR receptor-like serine threonine-protein kinase [Seminavis robusta]|uniref:LRR receptor-like serine threonine-protein kinase n=1 Tax=Seminavis robusta TaxID=568900 RepID=A0A9N8HAY4_9STRA|nr:LRR receptor-like serine threonine-protein kinase [Seminavis robusta]|eukprot:Sro242_g096630.1 LRR receptor-like serine threonine-protein kinase (941) ;mRNA; r:45436-48258
MATEFQATCQQAEILHDEEEPSRLESEQFLDEEKPESYTNKPAVVDQSESTAEYQDRTLEMRNGEAARALQQAVDLDEAARAETLKLQTFGTGSTGSQKQHIVPTKDGQDKTSPIGEAARTSHQAVTLDETARAEMLKIQTFNPGDRIRSTTSNNQHIVPTKDEDDKTSAMEGFSLLETTDTGNEEAARTLQQGMDLDKAARAEILKVQTFGIGSNSSNNQHIGPTKDEDDKTSLTGEAARNLQQVVTLDEAARAEMLKIQTFAAGSTSSQKQHIDAKSGSSDKKNLPTLKYNTSTGIATTTPSFTSSGVTTIEQLMRDGLDAPSPIPLTRHCNNRPSPAAPGAFRATIGQQPQQVSQLHKGGMDVLTRRYQDPMLQTEEGPSQDPMLQAEEGSSPPDDNHNFQDETRESVAITGELMTDTMQGKKLSYWTIAGAIGLLALIIIIAIVVGVTTSKDKSSPEEVDDIGTEEIAISLYTFPLKDVFPTEESSLSNETRQAILSENEQSPQVQAFQWLTQDENWQNYGMPQLQQRFALATVFYATGGPKWFDHVQSTNSYNLWLDYSTHECSWYGMPNVYGRQKCSNYTATTEASQTNPWDAHYHYQSLQLSANPRLLLTARNTEARLRGTLVPELALLTNLRELDIEHQSIKGTIPNELTQLSNTLQYIYLTKCFFTGTIPAQLFVSSRSLFMGHTSRLTASIPTAIGDSSQMAHLILTETNLQGTIPTELGLATKLQELLLNGNDLKGPLPSEIGQLSSLKVLDLTANRLSGSIPLEIGQAGQLQSLRLSSNFDLEGTLPTSLALLSNLQVLDIFKNSIEGALWPELFYVTSDFNGTSAVTASWPKLTTFIVTENGLTGPIPSEIGLSRSLKGLFLARNRFESQLPTELGLLSNLECLGITENRFTGQFPPVGAGLITDVNADLSASSELRGNFVAQCVQN